MWYLRVGGRVQKMFKMVQGHEETGSRIVGFPLEVDEREYNKFYIFSCKATVNVW